jgi:hypothetical protein
MGGFVILHSLEKVQQQSRFHTFSLVVAILLQDMPGIERQAFFWVLKLTM